MSPLRIGRRIVAVAPLAIALLAGACAPAPGPASAPAPTTTVAPNTPGQVFVTYQLDDTNASTQPLQLQRADSSGNWQTIASLAPGQKSAVISSQPDWQLDLSVGGFFNVSRWTCSGAPGRATNFDTTHTPGTYPGISLFVAAGETVRCSVYAHPHRGTLEISATGGAPMVKDFSTGASVAPSPYLNNGTVFFNGTQYIWTNDDVVGAPARVVLDGNFLPVIDVAITAPGATQIACYSSPIAGGTVTHKQITAPGYMITVARDELTICYAS